MEDRTAKPDIRRRLRSPSNPSIPAPSTSPSSSSATPNPTPSAAKTYSEPATLESLDLHAGDTSANSPAPASIRSSSSPSTTSTFTPAPATPDTAHHIRTRSSTPSASPSRPTPPPPNFTPASSSPPASPSRTAAPSPFPSPSPPPAPPSPSSARTSASPGNTSIHLADQDDLPVNQQLTFSLKSATPFPRTGKIEIANADETLHTTLTVASGNLILQNPHTLLATLDPLKAFGTSAFGPLRLRAVAPDGTTGDWLPLATLVRLPTLKDLRCPADATQPCTLSGSSLYLVDSIATDPAFTDPHHRPRGLRRQHPHPPPPRHPKTGFYLRLRDDPTATNSVTLPILPSTPNHLPGHPTKPDPQPVT